MQKLNVYLLTGRTIEQGETKEMGKTSNFYKDAVAVCYIDPSDMRTLKVRENSSVKVRTDFGSVVLRAVKSTRAPHPGVIYVPYGIWANQIVDPETHGIGMPSFKGIPAILEPAPDERVKDVKELLRSRFRK